MISESIISCLCSFVSALFLLNYMNDNILCSVVIQSYNLEERSFIDIETDKEIYIEKKRKTIEVVVLKNMRKHSKDSKKFSDLLEAQRHMYDYIRESTLS